MRIILDVRAIHDVSNGRCRDAHDIAQNGIFDPADQRLTRQGREEEARDDNLSICNSRHLVGVLCVPFRSTLTGPRECMCGDRASISISYDIYRT